MKKSMPKKLPKNSIWGPVWDPKIDPKIDPRVIKNGTKRKEVSHPRASHPAGTIKIHPSIEKSD